MFKMKGRQNSLHMWMKEVFWNTERFFHRLYPHLLVFIKASTCFQSCIHFLSRIMF